jgi:hypothetical protein
MTIQTKGCQVEKYSKCLDPISLSVTEVFGELGLMQAIVENENFTPLLVVSFGRGVASRIDHDKSKLLDKSALLNGVDQEFKFVLNDVNTDNPENGMVIEGVNVFTTKVNQVGNLSLPIIKQTADVTLKLGADKTERASVVSMLEYHEKWGILLNGTDTITFGNETVQKDFRSQEVFEHGQAGFENYSPKFGCGATS